MIQLYRKNRFLVLLCACTLSVFCMPILAGAAGKQITLTYAFFAPANTFPGKQMQHWADLVEKKTHGQVKVLTYAGGSLLNASNMYSGVKNGIADVGLGLPSYDQGQFPFSYSMSLPLGFRSSYDASVAYWRLLKKFNPPEFDGFKVLTAFATEAHHIQSALPVKSLADLKKVKFRAVGSNLTFLHALGVPATGMSMAQVPQAFQTGVINGIVTSREVLYDLKLANYIKYVLNYRLGVTVFAVVMKQSRFDKLPNDVKKVLNDLGPKMAKWTGHYEDKHVNYAMRWSEKNKGLKYVKTSAALRDKFDKQKEKMVNDWIQRQNKENTGIDGKAVIKFLKKQREELSRK